MRLDHLLSKEKEEVGVALLSSCQGAAKEEQRKRATNLSGGDTPGGDTRSHPEHDG